MMNQERINTNQFNPSNKEVDLVLANHKSEVSLEQDEDDDEILLDEKVQSILPYLTLDKLNKQEISSLVELAYDTLLAMDLKELPKDKFAAMYFLEKDIAIASGDIDKLESRWQRDKLHGEGMSGRGLFCFL